MGLSKAWTYLVANLELLRQLLNLALPDEGVGGVLNAQQHDVVERLGEGQVDKLFARRADF